MSRQTLKHIIVITLCLLLFIFSFLISPYKFAWDPILREVNEQGIRILKIIYGVLVVVLGIAIALSWKGKTIFRFIYLAMAVFLCYKMAGIIAISI